MKKKILGLMSLGIGWFLLCGLIAWQLPQPLPVPPLRLHLESHPKPSIEKPKRLAFLRDLEADWRADRLFRTSA